MLPENHEEHQMIATRTIMYIIVKMSYIKDIELAGKIKECVPLAISDLLCFLRLSKVRNLLYHGSVDRIQYK